MVYLVYNSRLEIISFQDLEGIVTCLLAFILLWKVQITSEFRSFVCGILFFSLVAVRDPLFAPEIWKFHNDRPCTGVSSIMQDVFWALTSFKLGNFLGQSHISLFWSSYYLNVGSPSLVF